MKQKKPEAADFKVLVVHPDLRPLSVLQDRLAQQGASVIVARDLPTALLAATQHYFQAAIISSRIAEEGDGWPLAGILRVVFAQAFVVVIAPERSVLTLKAAINNGLDRIFEASADPQEMVRAVVMGTQAKSQSWATGKTLQ